MIIRFGLLLFALLFRFYQLGLRPPHHDEAVNGWFVDGILTRGFYHYDSQNYHGPIFFYLLTFFQIVFGRSIEVLRTTPVLFGIVLAFTPFLFKRRLTDRGAWIAALFLTVSPAAVFFSRYTIHETAFAVSCILFLYFWLRVRGEGLSYKFSIALGASLGLMAGLKENFVILVGSLLIAEGFLKVFALIFDKAAGQEKSKHAIIDFKNKKFWINVSIVFATFASIVLASFSALGQDPVGVENFFNAFAVWSQTGSNGNGHQKPIYYWANLFLNYEWLALVGLILTPLALFKLKLTQAKKGSAVYPDHAIQLMSVLGFGLFLAYSIVNYKTPWCILSFYWALIFVGSYWISKMMESKKVSFILSIALILGFCFSATQAYTVAYDEVDSDHHPYIYGQTYRTLMEPMNVILARIKENPELKNTLKVQVISQYTWPLPWLLGELKQGAYYGEANAPAELNTDLVFIDQLLEAKFISRLKGNYKRTEVRARQWASSMVIFEKQ